jgi:hypothetical protein
MENKKKYFFGNEISEEGVRRGYVDYRTLAKCFDAVLCNDITRLFFCSIDGKYNEVEVVNGSEFDEDEDGNEVYKEVFQWYIIDNRGVDILQQYTNDIVYYIPLLDIYVWGVTHWGTSWDYVLTDIKIDW